MLPSLGSGRSDRGDTPAASRPSGIGGGGSGLISSPVSKGRLLGDRADR